jgi:hypothetical protein
MTHGMTATVLLPTLLGFGEIQWQVDALTAEWQPATHTERLLVEEMGRHAAALALIERAEAATWRRAASCLSEAAVLADLDDASRTDQILCAAAASEGLDRVTRYRRAHEKGLTAALQRLQDLQARRHRSRPAPLPALPFATEADCVQYLHDRGSADWQCQHCGHREAQWLERRAHWQCRRCRQQQSLRSGTVLAHSGLPIRTWFHAIWAILGRPLATTAAVAEVCGLDRLETARRIAGVIREALGDPARTVLLVGLDNLFADGVSRWRQTSRC